MAERAGNKAQTDAIVRGRGAVAGPAVGSLFRQTKLPALMNHVGFFFFFFLLSLPLWGNSVKRPGIQSSHSKLDRFHLRFSALWRQKLSHAYGLRCTEGAPSAPCSPGAGVVQDWLLCPFPRGEHGFLFISGNEPRPLVLGAHRLIFNSFHILRRTL